MKSKTFVLSVSIAVLCLLGLLAWGLGLFNSFGLPLDSNPHHISNDAKESDNTIDSPAFTSKEDAKKATDVKLPATEADERLTKIREKQKDPDVVKNLWLESWEKRDGFTLEALRLPNYKYRGDNTEIPKVESFAVTGEKTVSPTRRGILTERDNNAGRLQVLFVSWEENGLWYIKTATKTDTDIMDAFGLEKPLVLVKTKES